MSMTVLLALLLVVAAPARAQDVVVVLGSDLAPYREAYEGFVTAFGEPVELLTLGGKPPKGARVVVAFGGKAALQRYPTGVTLVYGLAPGVRAEREPGEARAVKIPMEPAPAALLGRLGALQPGLKRLAVLWASKGGEESVARLVQDGSARGVEVLSERLESADDLPAALRRLRGKADALWLPPDPLLINARNFDIIKRYAYDNDVPFYVPTEALAEKGAAAAVSVGYSDAGRAAAAAARAVLTGKPPTEDVFAGARVSVNRSAAAECGLVLPAVALKGVDKVYP